METVQRVPDDPTDVPEDHLHTDDTPEKVEEVNQRCPRPDNQEYRELLQNYPTHRLHPVVETPHRDQQRPHHYGRPAVLQADEPWTAETSQGVFEGVEEGAAEHSPEQRAEEGLEDEIDQDSCPAADSHKYHRPGVVEGLFYVLVKLQGGGLG